MTLIEKICCSLAAALWMATAASCGDPAERGAAPDRGAAAPAPVAGEVAVYKAASEDAGPPKTGDAAGSLPSAVTKGRSAVYAPPPGAPSAGEAAGQGTPP